MPFSITRRNLLRILALSGVTSRYVSNAYGEEQALSSPIPTSHDLIGNKPHPVNIQNQPTNLLVAGTENSPIGLWAKELSPSLASGFQSENDKLATQFTTGYDGVTGANLFDARYAPDDNTALLATGTVAIASLAGDKRVHFDYERWIPIFTALSPAITIARQPFHNSIPDRLRNRKLRVAVSTHRGLELPTLLGIELLKINVSPVIGLADYPSAVTALRNQQVDVIQINTAQGLEELPTLIKEGFHVFFSLDSNDKTYGPSFTDLYNNLPHNRNNIALYEAWNAIATAARLKMIMMLPMLTPSALVAKWRHVGNKILQTPEIIQFSQQHKTLLQESPTCLDTYSKLIPSFTATLALRRWLFSKIPTWQNNPIPN